MSVLPEHDHNLISNRDINRDAITCDQLASVAERYQHQRIYRTPIMKKQRSYEYSSSYNVNVATMSTAATGKEEDVMKSVAPMRTGTTGKDQAGMKTLEFPPGEEIDRLVAQAMLELSAEEREKALEETHGVVEVDKEDPDFIASCLDDLDNCLAIRKEDTAYAVAEQMSFEYVSNNRFRIMFLRAMRYIPQDACERIIQFFEYKKELFGAEKLVKDITLDDLSDDDLGPLEGGYIQVAPGEDMNRRPILIFCEKVKQQQNKQPENSIRTQFYILMSVLESEKAQKTGIVAVIYNVDCKGTTKSYGARLRNSLPLRYCSIHFCLNDEREFHGINSPMRSLGSNARSRYRQHFGSNEECFEKLAAFGIPRGTVPVQSDGTILLEQHTTWTNKRRQLEAARAAAPSPIMTVKRPVESPPISDSDPMNIDTRGGVVPSPGDILFGRGRKVRNHPGNARFLQLIDHYMKKYEKTGRVDKACIAEIIVRMIKDAECRFLKKDSHDVWGEVDDSDARKKVAHAFRNRRKLHGYGQTDSS